MLDGYYYPSVEHAYQAAKFPPQQREPFRNPELKAGEAKRMGRGKGGPDWYNRSLSIMEDLLWQKFNEPKLKAQLIATGDEHLIEGNNWHDQFFGDCYCTLHKDIRGGNHLGYLLMIVRDGMQNGWRPNEV